MPLPILLEISSGFTISLPLQRTLCTGFPFINSFNLRSRLSFVIVLIHSYWTLNFHRALLQENYSEALPTPARLKKSISKVRKKAGDRVVLRDKKFRREAVPFRGSHCGECTVLLSRGTGIRDKEKTLLEWAKWLRAQSTKERIRELTKGDRSMAIGQASSARLIKRTYMNCAA